MNTPTSPQNTPTATELAGRTLRMMREAHGVTLRTMAARVGVSPSHLSRIESGERAAGAELTVRLCEEIAALPSVKAA